MKTQISATGNLNPFSAAYFREIVAYKDLLITLVKRDVSVVYKQTVLGIAWAVFRPLVQMLVFTVIFGYFIDFQSKIGDAIPYAVFSFAALVPWTYFSVSMTSATNSLVSNANFLTKVYFPRIIIPLVPIISKLFDFGISFGLLLAMLLYYGITPNINALFIPVLVIVMILTSFGISLWLAALAIQYRDIQQLMQFLAQLLMYAAPVIWPISIVPAKFLPYYGFYPMAGVIEGFRAALLDTGPMPWLMIAQGAATAIFLFITGSLFFRKKEDSFADVV